MYSVVCRKVHECRFTLERLQRSIRRAQYQLDHERVEIAPSLMEKILLEREENEQKGENFLESEYGKRERSQTIFVAPFMPKHPSEILNPGNIYLKLIDENHRRCYKKFMANENSERNADNTKNIQQLYVRNK